MNYAWINTQTNIWPIAIMCHVLCASESGYYHHNAHGYAQKRIHDQALLTHIRATHAEVKGEYGWPRIWRALITKGVRASKERVRKLMQLNGIYARGKRKFVVTTDSKHNMRTSLVTDALRIAWFRCKPAKDSGLIFHSDRGSQYCSDAYQAELAGFGIKSLMSRKGDCWDNAPTESLWGSLKVGRLYGKRFATRREAMDESLNS